MYTSSKQPDYNFVDKINVPSKSVDITIENYAWISANVFINPGITKSENSIIGSNSIVAKEI